MIVGEQLDGTLRDGRAVGGVVRAGGLKPSQRPGASARGVISHSVVVGIIAVLTCATLGSAPACAQTGIRRPLFVTADTLNVRDAAHGAVVDQLSRGDSVFARQRSPNGPWLLVVYVSERQIGLSEGWVSSEYLSEAPPRRRLIAAPTSRGPKLSLLSLSCDATYSLRGGAFFCLTITDTSFNCDEAIFDEGFDECELSFDVDISTDYNGDDTPSVDVECSAEIDYRTGNDSWEQSEDESTDLNVDVYFGHGSDSGSIDFDFDYAWEPVTWAKATSLECDISWVNMY